MYYIYHIPNVKIGCTKNPQRRTKQQGFSSYEILETHDCIDRASQRELELQKEYGYEVDKSTYKESVQNIPKGKQHLGGSASLKKRWKERREDMLKQIRRCGIKGRLKQAKVTVMCDLDGNELKRFPNRRDAAKYVNGFAPPLIQTIRQPHKTYKGFKWKDG